MHFIWWGHVEGVSLGAECKSFYESISKKKLNGNFSFKVIELFVQGWLTYGKFLSGVSGDKDKCKFSLRFGKLKTKICPFVKQMDKYDKAI